MKKTLSILLLLAMLASLFAGLTLTASAASTTNTGTRHQLCTSLSSAAQAYYTGSNTWANFSTLAGSSDTSSTQTLSSPLFTALHNLMKNTLTHTVTYNSLTGYWKDTDRQAGGSDAILFYSDVQGSGYNREHVWPKSHGNFYQSGAGSDLHHLRPTDNTINSTRGNYTYGNVREKGSSYSTKNYGNNPVLYYMPSYSSNDCAGLVEVNDNIKGDVARILLYLYVTYNDSDNYNPNLFTKVSSYGSDNNANDGKKIIEDLDTLLEWMEIDPVDTWEMSRNDCVQAIQGNRNVFIDYPELAWKLFNRTVPTNYSTPSGNTVSYTVTATSNNNTYGTVSVSGTVITASPKTGYYAKDYTVTSGTASVTQNGNTFTVTPSSNCTVRINFAAKTSVTVTLNNNGSTSTKTGYAGDEMTLTAPTAPENYTFVGWVSSSVNESTTKPEPVYTTSFTPTASCTLYALFSHVVGSGGGSSTQFELYSGTITEGDYVITYQNGAMKAEVVNKRLGYTDVTVTNDVVSNPAASLIWHIAPSGSYWTIYNASANQYAASSGVKNNAALNSSGTDDKSLWTVTGSSAYEFENKYNKANSINALLRKNDTYGFATYSSSTGGALTLYKAGAGGTTYYTTSTGPACSHSYTSVVTQPTCTAAGYTTYTCSKCGDTYTGNEVAALGHNYGSFSHNASSNPSTHSKTCSRCSDKVTESCSYTSSVSGATTTFTCSVCHYSYQTTAQTFTVRYNVLGTVSATASCVEGQSVTLPAAATAVEDYTFCGWVTNTVDPEIETAPAILTGSFMPDQNITLYALYSRTEAGSGSVTPTLTKMVAGDTVADGDKLVIVAHDQNNVALYAETQSDSYVKKYTFDNKVASVLADSKNYLTVNAATNGYTLGDSTVGYLYTSGSNNLAMSTTNNTVWTLSDLGDGTFNLIAASGRKLSYRSDLTGDNQLWRMGGSTGTSGQTVLDLYKVTSGASSTTYYTTNPGSTAACSHENTTLTGYAAPSCTAAGYTGDLICSDCGEIVETGSVIPATGHSYNSSGICTVCNDKLISIDSASLRLNEDIDVIYNATVPDGATASMTFTMNGTSVTVNDDGSHSFIFEGVTPQCMGDNISATLTVTYGGRTYACIKASYSVKTYCVDQLAKSSTTTKLRKLLSDTLAYGAAAQTYMNYKTNALVTSGVTGTSYSTFTALSGLAPTFTGTAAESPCWTGVYVTLTDTVNIVFRFASPNKTGLSVKVTYNGKTTTFSGTSITAVSGMSGVYEVKLTGIKATDFGQTVTAKFYKSSAQVGDTLGYSVNTYVCAKQNDSSTALKNLVRALYNYGASAAAYAN